MNIKRFFIVIALFSQYIFLQAQKSTNALLSEGNTAFQNKNYAKSIDKYTQVLEQDKNNFKGAFNLGNALYRSGKYEEAQAMYERAAKISKENESVAASYYNNGNAFAKKQEWEKAATAYKNAIKKNPLDNNAQKNYQIAKRKLEQQQKNNNSSQQNQQQNSQDSSQNQEQNKEQAPKDDGKSPKKNGNNGNEKGKGDDANGQNPNGKNDKDAPAIPENTKNRILKSLSEKEAETQRRILNKPTYSEPPSNDKDW